MRILRRDVLFMALPAIILFSLTVRAAGSTIAPKTNSVQTPAAAMPGSKSAIATASTPSRALSPEEGAIVRKFQESRRGIVEAEAQKRKILGALYGINKRMKKITKEKGHLTDELFQVQDNVKSIAKLIAALEGQINQQRVHLRKRLRALYKLSGEGFVGIVFSRQDIHDLDETLRFLKIVTDNDYYLIRSYQENIAAYKAQRLKLHGEIERLVGIEHNIKKQEGLLAAEHHAKSKIVSELDRSSLENLDRIKVIRSQTRALAEQGSPESGAPLSPSWSEILKPSIFEQKGQLAAPVDAVLAQDFGLVTDEQFKIRLSHKGWRYRASADMPVRSIFDGTVVHANWIDGYGNTVILDHGDHYYSVYAHISHMKVSTGDTLKKGTALGDAEAGLYFEIRHFSEPENPANWIGQKAEGKPTLGRSTEEPGMKEHAS